ncbi:MAG TPA: type II secretion system protein [Candidatus Paceibacterota bacterium]|nr:type II secretion system protein [Candidatus Paceibacterota bacterium]
MESFRTHRDAFESLKIFSARRTTMRAERQGLAVARGFTLIELLVVVAIMIVLMSIVFTSQSSFNKTLILSNTAYDIALSLRSSEGFGLGSRVFSGMSNTGYGIHFQTGNTFTFFADTNPSSPSALNCHGLPLGGASAPDAKSGDCIYSAGLDQKVNDYSIGNGITISNFCAKSGTTWSCGLTSLDITFSRPNPIPFIRANGFANIPYSMACLTISSAQGGSRFITVSSSGEINANAASDPSSCHE